MVLFSCHRKSVLEIGVTPTLQTELESVPCSPTVWKLVWHWCFNVLAWWPQR